MSGILNTGVQVARGVSTTTIFLDDLTAPILNVQHQAAAGQISLSAGSNPAQGFTIAPVAQGNSQILTGPNINVSNVLTIGSQLNVPNANVGNVLNVGGAANIYGTFLANASATIANVLVVGNAINVPRVSANTITTSALSATGQLSNVYIETTSNLSSTTAALYLSPTWRIKNISSGGLAFQSFYNGQWNNSSVLAPTGVSISISNLTTPVT